MRAQNNKNGSSSHTWCRLWSWKPNSGINLIIMRRNNRYPVVWILSRGTLVLRHQTENCLTHHLMKPLIFVITRLFSFRTWKLESQWHTREELVLTFCKASAYLPLPYIMAHYTAFVCRIGWFPMHIVWHNAQKGPNRQ